MADHRRLNRLLAKGHLSGKEIARLVLQNHRDERAGRPPMFADADLARARSSLRGRPAEATIYSAWVEVAGIVDCMTMEAMVKALEVEKRLIFVIGSLTNMLQHGTVRDALRLATTTDPQKTKSRPMHPGWRMVQTWLEREYKPEKLQAIVDAIGSCQMCLRVYFARKTIIAVFSQEIGVDLFLPVLQDRDEAVHGMLECYNQLAERTREAEPDEEGFVPPDEELDFPKDFRLPMIDMAALAPDPVEVERMRQRLVSPLADDWWDGALELGVFGALADLDPDRKQRLRQRGRVLGSIDLALGEMVGAF